MNCNDIEKNILLAESGELPEIAGKDLERHLADCSDCSAYKRDTERMMSITRKNLEDGLPSERVLAGIRDAASKRVSGRILAFPPLAVQWFAYAAALVLVFGAWYMMAPLKGETDRVGEMSALISFASDEFEAVGTDREEVLDEMAEYLLTIQGFIETDLLDEENQDAELSPTALRLRSTRASPSQKCV